MWDGFFTVGVPQPRLQLHSSLRRFGYRRDGAVLRAGETPEGVGAEDEEDRVRGYGY